MTDALYAGGGIGLGPRPPEPEREPYPAPLVTSEDGVTGPTKAAVTDMVALVQRFGWSAKVTYAEGWIPHASRGTPGARAQESLAVRMWRSGQRAVAVYVDHGKTWSWDTLLYWRSGTWPVGMPGVGVFLDEITGSVLTVANYPWVGKPVHGMYRWHAPWIWPGQS